MSHKEAENHLKHIEREIVKDEKEAMGGVFTKPFFDSRVSIVIPDTCALIDLERLTREYRGQEAKYARPDIFLDNLIERNRVVLIPKGIINEVRIHRKVKLNSHEYELSQDFVSYLEELYKISNCFLGCTRYGLDSEQTGLDVYWASVLSCAENQKKQEEGFSNADKDLLTLACLLTTTKSDPAKSSEKISIGLVDVLSSDEHILRGADFLRERCGYKNLKTIHMRK